jgi:hypothetical protein
MSVYGDLATVSAKADARTGSYRFDLERDVPWDRASEPGRYIPERHLSDLGVQIPPPDSHAHSLMQWGYALAVAEVFAILEQHILDFTNAEEGRIPSTHSLELLREEEIKHIELFRRVEKNLRAARPEHVDVFEEAFAPTRAFFREKARIIEPGLDDAARVKGHYLFWMLVTFFEEYTVYIDECMQAESEGMQPLWLAAHALHRREEIQHLVTDANHLKSLTLDDAARLDLSKLFVIGIGSQLGHHSCSIPTAALVEKVFPELGPVLKPSTPVTRQPFFQDILRSPTFRRTREFAPYLVDLASRR